MIEISSETLVSYCIKKNKSLTPTRLLIIKTLSKYTKPKSAYELQKDINALGPKLNISTVYKIIEFWRIMKRRPLLFKMAVSQHR